ncbi:hypothetical protein ATB54_09400 [Xanthomonas translucens]|nr:hypothetical protein ATB54_09400 [Xanthomonas translucens]
MQSGLKSLPQEASQLRAPVEPLWERLQSRRTQRRAFLRRKLSRLKRLLQFTQQAIREPCRSGFSRDRLHR